MVPRSTGGPSHMDVFDPNPKRPDCDAEAAPEEFAMEMELGFSAKQFCPHTTSMEGTG